MILRDKKTLPYWLRLVIWFSKIGLVVFVVVGIYKWVNTPVKGEIIKTDYPKDEIVVENNAYGNYDGKLVSFTYKPGYTEVKEENNIVDGDKVVLNADKGKSNRIVVVAKLSTETNIEEIPAVQMRKLKPEEYTKETMTVDGSPALTFKTKTEYEKVMITIKAGKLVTVSLTANSNDNTLDDEFLTLVNSLKIK